MVGWGYRGSIHSKNSRSILSAMSTQSKSMTNRQTGVQTRNCHDIIIPRLNAMRRAVIWLLSVLETSCTCISPRRENDHYRTECPDSCYSRGCASSWLIAAHILILTDSISTFLCYKLILPLHRNKHKNTHTCTLEWTCSQGMNEYRFRSVLVVQCLLWSIFNPLKGRDVNWLHFAIQV